MPDIADSEAEHFLKDAAKAFGRLSSDRLVAYAQREKGAWARCYVPGKEMIIEDESILAEYRALWNKMASACRAEEEPKRRG